MNDRRADDEPKGVTLVDLLALVVGAAIAAAVRRGGPIHSILIFVRGGAPGWFIAGNWLVEVLHLTGLALIPVIFLRRVRHGGMVRPAEFLPMAFGIGPLLEATWSGLIAVPFSIGKQYFYPDAPTFWSRMSAEIVLAILAGVALALRRGRSRDWVDGFLLLVAWVGLDGPASLFYLRGVDGWIGTLGLSPWGKLLAMCLLRVPTLAVGYSPLAAAFRDRYRLPRPTWTWVEWAGLVSTGSFAVLWQVQGFVQRWLNGEGSLLVPVNALFAAAVLASLVASFGLVWLLGPAWRRLFSASPAAAIENSEAGPVKAGP